MKNRMVVFASLLSVGLLSSTALLAQSQTQADSQQSMNPSTAPVNGSATVPNSTGQATVNSTMGTAPSTPPPPAFSDLAGKKNFISKADAVNYPPLANDFDYADSNRDGRISKAEYNRWVSHFN